MTSYLDYIDSDPYDYYAAQLKAGPVHWDDGMRAWLAFGYEESRFVATRQDFFRHPYNELRGAREVQGGTRGILMLQGGEHDRMRNFLLSHFTPAVARRYREELIRPLVRRRIEGLASHGRVDLAAEFASKIRGVLPGTARSTTGYRVGTGAPSCFPAGVSRRRRRPMGPARSRRGGAARRRSPFP